MRANGQGEKDEVYQSWAAPGGDVARRLYFERAEENMPMEATSLSQASLGCRDSRRRVRDVQVLK